MGMTASAHKVLVRFAATQGALPPVDLQIDEVETFLNGLIEGVEELDGVEDELGLDLRNLTKLLAKYPHNDDIHHSGEDVLTHTKWVLEDIQKLVDDKDAQKRQMLSLVALLHDVGKAYTYEWRKDKSKHTFYGHAEVSVRIAEKLLAKLRKDNAQLYKRVLDLIRLHDVFMRLIDARKGASNLKYLNKFMREAVYLDGHLDDLVAFSKADGARARRIDETLEGVEGVLQDIKQVEKEQARKKQEQARQKKLSPKDEAAIRKLLEAQAPHVVELLPDLQAIRRALQKDKNFPLLQQIGRMFA